MTSEYGFVMVPKWFRKSHPNGNAMLAYVAIASFGSLNTDTGIYEECRPSLASLAKESGLPRATLQRAIKELLESGAITRTMRRDADGGSLPTVYRVRFKPPPDQEGPLVGGGMPASEHPGDQEWAAGVPMDGQPGCPPVSTNLDPNTQTPNTQNKNTSPAADAAGGGVITEAIKPKKATKGPEPVRPEVERLCQLLADLIAGDGTKRPTVGKAWRDECRRLMDLDGASEKQVEYVIRWSQGHSFWSTNILSMPKLREQYAQLVKRIKADHVKPVSGGPMKSFKQQDEEAKAAKSDYFRQAREAWKAANPGKDATSSAAYVEVMEAADVLEAAAKGAAANALASCSGTLYSDAIEGEFTETTPYAIGGGQA